MGCQKKFAEAIRAANADYVLRVKANHGQLYDDLQDCFAHAEHNHFAQMTHSHDRVVNKDHGRLKSGRVGWSATPWPLVHSSLRWLD